MSNAQIAEQGKPTGFQSPIAVDYVSLTSLSTGLRYRFETRRYSLFGDSCQQFIINFCKDICVDIDDTSAAQPTIASQLIHWLMIALYTLGAVSSVDLFLNRDRLLAQSIAIPVTGLCMMTVATIAHPRMYSARLH
jgi:hypothetical protein